MPDAGATDVVDLPAPMFVPLLLAFAAFGALWGTWAVLLPELSSQLAPSPGELGLALSMGVVGSIPAMLVGGQLVDRFGPGRLGGASGVVYALGVAAIGLVGSYALLVLVLLLAFAVSGIYDVAINAAAIDLERRSGRRVLPVLHAAFSGGGALGAAATAVGLGLGASYHWLYLPTAMLLAFVALFWARMRGAPHERVAPSPGQRTLFRSRLLLVLGVATALAFFAEGTMESWSAIYLRGTLGLSLVAGSSGPALFHGAMCIGRLVSSTTVRQVGRRTTMAGAGAAIIVGMTVALVTSIAPLALAGFAVVGLSLASIAPVTLSLAGEAGAGRAGQASAVITTLGYSGFLFGPALIGGLAQATSLRLALETVALAGLGVLAIGLWIRPRGSTPPVAKSGRPAG